MQPDSSNCQEKKPAHVTVSAVALLLLSSASAHGQSLQINEFDYDQPGVDNVEWVEIKSLVDTEYELSGVELVLYDGNLSGSCQEYCRVDLSPLVFIIEGGTLVIGQHPAALLPLCSSIDAIQNGEPDAIALFDHGILIDHVEYASDRVNTVCNYFLAKVEDSSAVAGSISFCLGTILNRWRFTVSTPGAENDCTTPTDVPETPAPTFSLVKCLFR